MVHWSSIHRKEASHGRNRDHHTTVDTAGAFGDAATTMRAGRVADPTRVADPRPIADPGRSTANGDGPMMISGVVGERAAGTAPAGIGARKYFSEPQPNPKGQAMPQQITSDQVVATAHDLEQPEFTRGDLAEKLGVEQPELRKGFRQARRAGRLDKVRDDDEGTGHFRLTS